MTSSVVLPVPGRRFDDQRVVERLGDGAPGVRVGHRMVLSASRSASRSGAFRFTRSSSRGPHTGRKSHHVQARSAGAATREPVFDGAIDDGQRLEALSARVVVDRNLVLRETAGRRAVEQPACDDFLAQPLLDRDAVQHRLQHRPAADNQIRIRSVLARLVIGDPQHVEIGPMLDEIDRAAEDEAAVDDDRIRQAARVAPLVVQPEAELEVLRLPGAAVGELLHPDAEVAPQLVDLVAPHAIDRRRELFRVVGRDAFEHGVERFRPRAAADRPTPAARFPPASRGRTPPGRYGTGCRA